MKAFLALGVKKSVLGFFANSFRKVDFIDLVEFDFLNLAKFDCFYLADFIMVNRFLIFLPIPPLLTPLLTAPGALWFFLFLQN